MVSLLLTLLSVFCATIPMLGFLVVVSWMDRYEREPIWLLGLTFLWGAVGSILVALIGSQIAMLPLLPASAQVADAAGAVVVAPLVEEPAKALFLLFVMWNRHFDNMTDGFVYGAAAGLGFGMTENFLYFASVASTGSLGAWLMTVVIRTFYSAVMHATATSIVGAALAFARFRGCALLVVAGVVGLGMAMGVHMLWNGLITLEEVIGSGGAFGLVNFLLFPLELLVIFVVFQVCLIEESFTIRRELAGEVDSGLVPEGHPRIVSSWFLRWGRSWIPDGAPRARYIRTLTALAMRKRQVRSARGRRSVLFYRDEVDRLRRQLRRMLGDEEDT